jgi:DNA-binding transcriptional MocR family regulator
VADRSRRILSEVVTFDLAPPPGTINLGIGQPSADLLPVDLMHAASDRFFDSAEPFDLNYGEVRGGAEFLSVLAGFLTEGYGSPADANELFVTGGNSQAMDLVSAVFAKPGDTVFVEEPTYFLAFKIFQDRGLNIVGIPIDDDGLRVDALEEALESHNPAFLYTIPSFHNPGGQSTSAERRRRIVELAVKHDFLIVADEVYQMLYYHDAPPPAYGTMTSSKKVLSLGSFSKILAPAMRLGWIQASNDLLQQIEAYGFVNSGGCINHLGAHIARYAIESGALNKHIKSLCNAFRARLDVMHDALNEHFADIASWSKPTGGYFVWIKFDESVDTRKIRAAAWDAETGYQSGATFSSQGRLGNYMRLSFAHYNEDDIQKGVARLRPLFD